MERILQKYNYSIPRIDWYYYEKNYNKYNKTIIKITINLISFTTFIVYFTTFAWSLLLIFL